MDDGSITLLVALIVLIAFSAFFSASETAFSSLNQIRLKSRAEEGDTSAARVLAMAEKARHCARPDATRRVAELCAGLAR